MGESVENIALDCSEVFLKSYGFFPPRVLALRKPEQVINVTCHVTGHKEFRLFTVMWIFYREKSAFCWRDPL